MVRSNRVTYNFYEGKTRTICRTIAGGVSSRSLYRCNRLLSQYLTLPACQYSKLGVISCQDNLVRLTHAEDLFGHIGQRS